MTALATVGVYGFSATAFLGALRDHDVRLVLDIRQRRGVRGSDYSWANAKRLEAALSDAGIDYRHELSLAPTTELRRLQYREDDRLGVGKRSRAELAPQYARRYVAEILDPADLDAIVSALARDGRSALLCVERDARACHRSLVAARLVACYGLDLVDVTPSTMT